MKMLKTSNSLVAPEDSELQGELSEIAASMKSRYGKGEYCSDRRGGE